MTPIFTAGRICYKTTGRDAGSKVIVIESAEKGYAIVEGNRTKKGRVNTAHLLPTTKKAALSASYTKKELEEALKE
ncbi:MAG: 50S ribosomal protein L14e [archaeon]